MSKENYDYGYYGLDGGKYKSLDARRAADTRYKQQQKLIEEQQKNNRLLEEQKRINSGSNAANDALAGLIGYAIAILLFYPIVKLIEKCNGNRSENAVVFSVFIITEIVGILFGYFAKWGIILAISMYLIAITFVIEAFSIFSYKEDKGTTSIVEILFLIIGIAFIVVPNMSLYSLNQIIPIFNKEQWKIVSSVDYKYKYKIESFYIDGDRGYSGGETIDADKTYDLEIRYYDNDDIKRNVKKIEVEFNAQDYYISRYKKCKLKDWNYDISHISLQDLIQEYENTF